MDQFILTFSTYVIVEDTFLRDTNIHFEEFHSQNCTVSARSSLDIYSIYPTLGATSDRYILMNGAFRTIAKSKPFHLFILKQHVFIAPELFLPIFAENYTWLQNTFVISKHLYQIYYINRLSRGYEFIIKNR